jgi:hypothetical protein
MGSYNLVYAIDGFISAEIDSDVYGKHLAPDFQGQLGQVFGDYRIYGAFERCNETPIFTNSDEHYRLGIEYNHFDNLKLEAGPGLYHGRAFLFGKITYSFDTSRKGDAKTK